GGPDGVVVRGPRVLRGGSGALDRRGRRNPATVRRARIVRRARGEAAAGGEARISGKHGILRPGRVPGDGRTRGTCLAHLNCRAGRPGRTRTARHTPGPPPAPRRRRSPRGG